MSAPMLFAGAVLGLVAVLLLVRLLRRKKPKPWMQVATCPNCGWSGETSRYAGRCPACNTPIGEQRLKRTQ